MAIPEPPTSRRSSQLHDGPESSRQRAASDARFDVRFKLPLNLRCALVFAPSRRAPEAGGSHSAAADASSLRGHRGTHPFSMVTVLQARCVQVLEIFALVKPKMKTRNVASPLRTGNTEPENWQVVRLGQRGGAGTLVAERSALDGAPISPGCHLSRSPSVTVTRPCLLARRLSDSMPAH